MSIFFIRGIAVGVAAAAAALVYGPAAVRASKPLLREGVKNATVAYMKGRETLADLMEVAEDAYAEACEELRNTTEQAADEESDGSNSQSASNKNDLESDFNTDEKRA